MFARNFINETLLPKLERELADDAQLSGPLSPVGGCLDAV